MRNCALCLKDGPHFHIIVENGWVTSVEYISTKSYWDRELPKDEYTVGYRTSVPVSDSPLQRVLHAISQMVARTLRRKPTEIWLTPKVYKGKSMHEEELENHS